jgi:SAM-dependent methyltransferase
MPRELDRDGVESDEPAAVLQSYWDASYDAMPLAYHESSVLFKDLFDRFLPHGGDCLEIGCYPGSYLIYLGKRFGYTLHGIDATPHVTALPAFFASKEVRTGEIIHGDFLAFRPRRTYDVVASFGFVEHFYDLELVLRKHAELVAPGGTLVVSCPNFRRVQWLLHRALDYRNLKRHVLASMDLRRWRDILDRAGLDVIWDGYYRTIDFWADSPGSKLERSIGKRISSAARFVDQRLRMPNRFTSPYLVSISRKPGGG